MQRLYSCAITFNNPVAVGEHPGLLEEMDAAVANVCTKESSPHHKQLQGEKNGTEEEPTLFEGCDYRRVHQEAAVDTRSKATGERYLPEKAIKALSAKEYAATTRATNAEQPRLVSKSPNSPRKSSKSVRQS